METPTTRNQNNKIIFNIFIGNLKTKKTLCDYPELNHNDQNLKSDISQIFNKFLEISPTKNTKNKISTENNKFLYFSVSENNILYIITTISQNFNENSIFDLIEEIDRRQFYSVVDKEGKLSNVGKQNIQYLFDKFEKNNSEEENGNVQKTKREIDEIGVEMKKNVKNVIGNMDDLRNLEFRSNKIKDTALLFKRDANELERNVRWRKWKTRLMMFVGLLVLIGIVAYIFYF